MIRLDFVKQGLTAFLSIERHNAIVIDNATGRTLGAYVFTSDSAILGWQSFPRPLTPYIKRRQAQRQAKRQDYQRVCTIIGILKARYLEHLPIGGLPDDQLA